MRSSLSLAVSAFGASAVTALGFVAFGAGRGAAPQTDPATRLHLEALEREIRELRAAQAGSVGAPREAPALVGRGGDASQLGRADAAEQGLATAPAPAPAPAGARALAAWSEQRRLQNERIEDWRGRIAQVTDAAQRDGALREVSAALTEQDPAVVEAALRVFEGTQLAGVSFDREALRTLVLPHLQSDRPRIPWRAAAALRQIRPAPDDPERILARLERDPDVDLVLLAYVFPAVGDRRAAGRVADLFVRLLATDDPRRAFEALTRLEVVHVPLPVYEAVVAATLRHGRPETRDEWLLALARVLPRREAGIEAVFELLSKPDPEGRWHGYVLEGLAVGIAEESRPTAARRAADLLLRAPTSGLRQAALRALQAQGSRDQAGVLRGFVANPLVPEGDRAQARKVLERLERR